MEGPAKLADFAGTGALAPERLEGGETLLTGLWQADDPEHAYEQLHRLYMAREKIPFHGPVAGDAREAGDQITLEVIIVEWSNEDHPASLKLQEATEEY